MNGNVKKLSVFAEPVIEEIDDDMFGEAPSEVIEMGSGSTGTSGTTGLWSGRQCATRVAMLSTLTPNSSLIKASCSLVEFRHGSAGALSSWEESRPRLQCSSIVLQAAEDLDKTNGSTPDKSRRRGVYLRVL